MLIFKFVKYYENKSKQNKTTNYNNSNNGNNPELFKYIRKCCNEKSSAKIIHNKQIWQ